MHRRGLLRSKPCPTKNAGRDVRRAGVLHISASTQKVAALIRVGASSLSVEEIVLPLKAKSAS